MTIMTYDIGFRNFHIVHKDIQSLSDWLHCHDRHEVLALPGAVPGRPTGRKNTTTDVPREITGRFWSGGVLKWLA